MRNHLVILFFLLSVLFSCGEDDSRSCTTCTQEQTPDFQVCEEPNGSASVNGQNTGVSYEEYLASLQTVGASCGN